MVGFIIFIIVSLLFLIVNLLGYYGLSIPMFFLVISIITSVLLMIWNYRSIEEIIEFVHTDSLMGRLLTKFIIHTILWTIFVVSFVLTMIN